MNRLLNALAVLAALGPLAATPPKPDAPGRPPPKAGIQSAKRVTVRLHDPDTGKEVAVLRAAKVTPDPNDRDNLLATTVHIVVYQEDGNHIATADAGVINMPKKRAHLRGNVLITFGDAPKPEDRTRVKADNLLWDGSKSTATTDGPVEIIRPDMTTTGVGMTLLRRAGHRPAAGQPDRRGRLIIHRNAKSTIRTQQAKWLAGTRHKNPHKATQKPKAPPPPITVVCKGPLTIERATANAVYERDVRAVQGEQTLTCEKLTATFRPGAKKGSDPVLDTLVAEGRVRIDNGTIIAFADTGVLEPPKADPKGAGQPPSQPTTKLTGSPAEVRWDNGNRLTGGLIHQDDKGNILCAATPAHPGSVHLLVYASLQQQPQRARPATPRKALPRRPQEPGS